jgi:hypothetical protein
MDKQREAFEAWAVKRGGGDGLQQSAVNPGNYRSGLMQFSWLAWQAATAAERERAAKVCDRLSEGAWLAAQIRKG